MKKLSAFVVLVLLAGCPVTLNVRDERTIADVKLSQSYAERDAQRAIDALLTAATLTAKPEDGAAIRRKAKELEGLRDANLNFHTNWLYRETQKVNQ